MNEYHPKKHSNDPLIHDLPPEPISDEALNALMPVAVIGVSGVGKTRSIEAFLNKYNEVIVHDVNNNILLLLTESYAGRQPGSSFADE